jgi:competence protein ComEA
VSARPGRHAGPRLSLPRRLLGRTGDTVAPSLQGGLGITAHHVTVAALVLAAAMAVAAWMLVRSVPEPLPRRASLQLPAGATPAAAVVPTSPTAPASSPVSAAAAAPVTGTAGAVASPADDLVVHVAGKVRRPGVRTLPAGARVVDAIEAAGGARPGARLGLLNLARPLVDGEQIAVGVAGAVAPALPGVTALPAPSAPVGSTGALVNLNTATQVELEELPDVGPVTATSIMEWRTEHGGFSTVDELLEVSGIGEVTLGELRPLVTV